MKPNSIAVYSVSFLAGVGVGLWGSHFFREAENHRTTSVHATETAAKDLKVPPERPALSSLTYRQSINDKASNRRLTVDRLKTLSWASKQGFGGMIPVLGGTMAKPELDSRFIAAYDLTPEETESLNATIATAVGKLEALEVQNAKILPAPSGSGLVIEVPPSVVEGGAVYDDLIHSFAAVLGPDRFSSFNDVSLNTFASGFSSLGQDWYGLADVRYELTPSSQATNTGDPVFRLKVVSNVPGQGSATSESSDSLVNLKSYFPVVNQVLPSAYQTLLTRK